MSVFILIFTILFAVFAVRRLDLAVAFLIFALPAYLIRFKIHGLPSTLLEVMIWVVFLTWCVANFSELRTNLANRFKNKDRKIKRYPFDAELILLLIISFVAAGISGFTASALGIWKAYFFEPALVYIVVFNIAVQKYRQNKKKNLEFGIWNLEFILWPLLFSVIVISLFAIYQKITGQFIGNPLWAAEATRRVVSFFGYPNAIGLYVGPLVLVFIGWLFAIILKRRASEATEFRNKILNFKFLIFKQFSIFQFLKIFLIAIGIVLSILSIIFAKSNGAGIGVGAGLIVFGILANKKSRKITSLILLILILGAAIFAPARNLALKYLTLSDFSGQVRQAQWRETLTMLKDGRIVTGAGLDNYQKTIAPYHVPGFFYNKFNDPDFHRKTVFNAAYRKLVWQPLEIYMYPHNILLNFWSELGLAGMLLFIWIIGKYFVLGIRNLELGIRSRRKEDYLISGLMGAMVMIIVQGIVDVPYFKNDLSVMFWIFVAMLSLLNIYKET